VIEDMAGLLGGTSEVTDAADGDNFSYVNQWLRNTPAGSAFFRNNLVLKPHLMLNRPSTETEDLVFVIVQQTALTDAPGEGLCLSVVSDWPP
jgi:hypothetical protein